jgi:hypothetical protein
VTGKQIYTHEPTSSIAAVAVHDDVRVDIPQNKKNVRMCLERVLRMASTVLTKRKTKCIPSRHPKRWNGQRLLERSGITYWDSTACESAVLERHINGNH